MKKIETFENHAAAQEAAEKYYNDVFGQRASVYINESEDFDLQTFEILSADDPANVDTFLYRIAE